MAAETERIRVSIEPGLMHIELNRPEAINALTGEMLAAIDSALDIAEASNEIAAVVFSGAGERGFCAGGDVRQLALEVASGDDTAPRRYFEHEYALNARIAAFEKSTVALMRGVCMGGGVGLAGHSRIRVVSPSSRVAMPETKIGFTPDVGGSWLLGRAPGRLGERLGLHGWVMGPAEAIEAGFADLMLADESWDLLWAALRTAVAHARDIRAELSAVCREPGQAEFGLDRAAIDQVYALESVPEIIAALRRLDPSAAAELEQLSPTSLAVTLRSIRSARDMTLPDALAQELRLAEWFFTSTPDAREGIRALLIDKDRSPNWAPLAESLPI